MTMTMILGAIIFLCGGIVFGFIASGAFSSQAFSSGTVSRPAGKKRKTGTAGKTATKRTTRTAGKTAAKRKENLKLISGVGPAIEKKLNAMGVTRYEQIAKWTKADIEKADKKLNFKGRIKRENWISQARTLASGGETAFSKRKK